MSKISSVEDLPEEYKEIKDLLRRVPKDDLPSLELNESNDCRTVEITFNDQLRRRYGDTLKNSLQAQFSTQDIWDDMIRELLDSSSSTSTVNSIVHHSYSTQDQETPTQIFAGFLLRLSIRLHQNDWSGLLFELYHDDLDEFEVQFLRFYHKRDHDIRTQLKRYQDSRVAINSRNYLSCAVESLFEFLASERWHIPEADKFETRKLVGTLMTRFSKDSLSFSDFGILLRSLSRYSPWKAWDWTSSKKNMSVKHALKWPLPSTIGLDTMLESHLNRLDAEIDCLIREFFDNRTPTDFVNDSDSLPYPAELEAVGSDKHWAFYALPGCGKTRSLEILLSRNWGFIFTAGSLPVTKNDTKRSLASDSNIYDPRREGYSKDLHYLWLTINTYFQMFTGESDPLKRLPKFYDYSEVLVLSRLLVFERFLSIKQDANPADWLKFQIHFDPFSPLFWLLVLKVSSCSGLAIDVTHQSRQRLWNIEQILKEKNVGRVFVVLDEAQHDLDAKFCFYSELSPELLQSEDPPCLKDATMMQYSNSLYIFFSELLSQARQELMQVTSVLSGTSLRLEEMMAYCRTQLCPVKYELHSDFPLLRSEKEFVCLLRERKLNPEIENQLELIERHSRRLRGRYLWSTLYIDQLKILMSPDRILDEAAIKKAADDVEYRAKNDLKKRLTRFYEHSSDSQKTQRLLDHLCWIVVNCDLLDRPKTIALQEYEALVDQGFAVVSKDKATQGCLEESLAMEAALEWFRINQPGLLRRKMHEVLQISVLDDSNLGNAAEWFLAFELYNLLQDQEDRLLGSSGSQRRRRVLTQLFKAEPMFETPNPLDLDPDNYSLVIGERIGYNYTGQSCRAPSTDSTASSDLDTQSSTVRLEIWNYLESLRNPGAKPRPTFYFPEHNAGPDLVFALEPINPKNDKVRERILCVVQLKTAGAGVGFQKAIMTTDLSQSYLNKPGEQSGRPWRGTQSGLRRCRSEPLIKYNPEPDALPKKSRSNHAKMKQELQAWEGRTVIRILIATQKGSVNREDMEAVKRNWNEVNKLNDYFVMFGKGPSQDNNRSADGDRNAYVDDLFGHDFMSLLDQLKSKDTKAVIAARVTPEEEDAKRQERQAERELAKTRGSPTAGISDLFDTPDSSD